MSEALKPCPFCGERPYTRTTQDEDLCTHNIVDWHFVGCSNCDVSFGIPDGYDCGTAPEQWNTRSNADLDAALAANRELVRQLAEVRKAGDALADACDKMNNYLDTVGTPELDIALATYRNATTAKETT